MITIIICTYNREKYIRPLLNSIAKNNYPTTDYEIVLVDNNCTDNTRGVCEQFAAEHPEIAFRYVTEPEQGLSAARNKGIKEAKGDIIIYVDDDALVDSDYIRIYAEHFAANPDTMAAGGPIEPLYETQEPLWMSPYTKALLIHSLIQGIGIGNDIAGENFRFVCICLQRNLGGSKALRRKRKRCHGAQKHEKRQNERRQFFRNSHCTSPFTSYMIVLISSIRKQADTDTHLF